jgi:GR25 family glycosyltransferase involved in LPS biosynthesis
MVFLVRIYIICVDSVENGERFKLQKKQFLEIFNSSFGNEDGGDDTSSSEEKNNLIKILSIEFVDAFTPKNSIIDGYLDKDQNNKTLNGFKCCIRSHFETIRRFEKTSKDEENQYALVIEDDVVLLNDEMFFKKYLNETITQMIKENNKLKIENKKEIDFVSVAYHQGWMNGTPIKSRLSQMKMSSFDQEDKSYSHPILYYGFREVNFTLWGTQAYLIGKPFCKRFIEIFGEDSEKKTASQIWDIFVDLRTNKVSQIYAQKGFTVSPDAILPALFNQGFMFPAIGVEKEYERCLSSKDTKCRSAQFKRYLEFLKEEGLDKKGYSYWFDISCECDDL